MRYHRQRADFAALSQLAVEIQANAKHDVVKPGSEFFYAGLMA